MPKESSQPLNQVLSTSDLAAKLGLSRWAVSRALNGRGGVSKATTARVRDALAEHHFEPDFLARGLRGGLTGVAGVCVPRSLLDPSRPSHDGLHPQTASTALDAMYKRLAERGFFAITATFDTPEQEAEATRRMLGLRVEALLLVTPNFQTASPVNRSIQQAKTVSVAVDPTGEAGCTTLRFDHLQAARLALGHLHQLGHKRLALLGIPPKGRLARACETGCPTLGLTWRTQVRLMHLDDARTSPLGGAAFGWALVEALLRKRGGVTGLLAGDDQIAAGALARLRHEGKAVPRDFSLIGYGNLELGGFADPPLATIDPQAARLFERAVDTLREQVSAAGQVETQEILINPLFLKRASTGPPPPL